MKTLFKLLLYPALLIGFLLSGAAANAQVTGCTDPKATNYNATATVNNGSCEYPTTDIPVRFKVNLGSGLSESSGLQMAGGYLWSFNDSGHEPAIYRVDTTSGAVLQKLTLQGATNVDWEDIAFDGTHLYIGDFGNNATGGRTDLKIYKFPLTAIPDVSSGSTGTIASAAIEIIRFTYEDQLPVVATGSNNTAFDCEAMLVDDGKIHLFSKNWTAYTTTHYLIEGLAAGTYVAKNLETLTTGYRVTAADKAPGANMVVLMGYRTDGFYNHSVQLLWDYRDGLYFNGNKRVLRMGNVGNAGQAEGLTLRNSTYGYISNEAVSALSMPAMLHSFVLTEFVSLVVLPVSLQSFSVTPLAGQHQVQWLFTEPVQDLVVQYSQNRRDALPLHRAGTSSTGTFLHQPQSGTNCYRLSWKTASGTLQYSAWACRDSKETTAFSNLLLRSSGELTFQYKGGGAQAVSFRLLTADGRMLARLPQQQLTAGSNRLNFPQYLPQHSVLLLEAIRGKEKNSHWVKVE